MNEVVLSGRAGARARVGLTTGKLPFAVIPLCFERAAHGAQVPCWVSLILLGEHHELADRLEAGSTLEICAELDTWAVEDDGGRYYQRLALVVTRVESVQPPLPGSEVPPPPTEVADVDLAELEAHF